MTNNNISTIATTIAVTVIADANTIFDRLPGQAYDASCDRLVKAHMIKVVNNADDAKVCDVVDLRLAVGDNYHDIESEGLTIIGVDGIIHDMRSLYWILNGLHDAGNSWDEIKASLVSDEEAWI